MLFARTRRALAAAVLLAVALPLGSIGCGGSVEMKEIDRTAGIPKEDEATVKQHLDKAGITGEILKIEDFDEGKSWLVLISDMKPPEPGKRAALSMPKSYEVNKTTGTVKQAM